VLPLLQPMPLASVREPFDDRDWIFEPKWDGFRALAYIDGHRCRLRSRKGHVYKSWSLLAEELAHVVQCRSAVLDGEIVCLEPDGPQQLL
jgi:bifunctional non-homologous end joining protein LigD